MGSDGDKLACARREGRMMGDKRDRSDELLELVAQLRPVHDAWSKGVLPESYIARMRQCEFLASKTTYPDMAALMRKLAELWREMAMSVSPTCSRPLKEDIAASQCAAASSINGKGKG